MSLFHDDVPPPRSPSPSSDIFHGEQDVVAGGLEPSGDDAATRLRFTTKFDAVEPLLHLAHRGRTRMRASIDPARFNRFEGGTSSVASRLAALARMREAGYPIGLTIAPIIAAEGWEAAYAALIDAASLASSSHSPTAPSPDLTIELITHRYNEGSRAVLQRWYPGSDLEMGTEGRSEKRTRFGSVKQVYDAITMRALRTFFEAEIARALPSARILSWT